MTDPGERLRTSLAADSGRPRTSRSPLAAIWLIRARRAVTDPNSAATYRAVKEINAAATPKSVCRRVIDLPAILVNASNISFAMVSSG